MEQQQHPPAPPPASREELLRAIALSSGLLSDAPQQQEEAYRILQEFQSQAQGGPLVVLASALELVRSPQFVGQQNVTTPAHLFGWNVISDFVHHSASWKRLSRADCVGLRNSVLGAAAAASKEETEPAAFRLLALKRASVLCDLAVREFPQEWPTFLSDLQSLPDRYTGLACLSQLMEDCTDSDFNARLVTTRRNDVLLGLNDGHGQFLPAIYASLEQGFGHYRQAKTQLLQQRRDVTPEEARVHQAMRVELDTHSRGILDCLVFVEKCCQAMPLEWMFGSRMSTTGVAKDATNSTTSPPRNDYVQALLYLLQEAPFQVAAARCLEYLAQRKLASPEWWGLLEALPPAWQQAQTAAGSSLEFDKEWSKLQATLVSAHLAHITADKDMSQSGHVKRRVLGTFLELMTQVLAHHASGLVASEQMNMWTALLRDAQVVKLGLLEPYLARVFTAFWQHTIRIPWQAVEDGTHPQTSLLEESWTDKEEYDTWLSTLRSKASQLFKFIAHTVPDMAATLVEEKTRHILSTHGQPPPANTRLTPTSPAILALEGLCQPLENVMQGVPTWTLQPNVPSSMAFQKKEAQEAKERQRVVQTSLARVAEMICSWNPTDLWLKFRRATLLDTLKHYWKHDPKTLLTGVDALLVYLSAQDEWPATTAPTAAAAAQQAGWHPQEDGGWLSGDVVGLRKKTGVVLVSVAKRVPEHLVGWLQPLSERAKSLLSTPSLLPPNRMHLYEFLSCVATAVEDATARAQFIADVLANALVTLESPEVVAAVASVEGLLEALGVGPPGQAPAKARDVAHVSRVTARYVRLFSALNQLLSVGKRCHEAARKRPNGGIPVVVAAAAGNTTTTTGHSFADEGPVSLADLAKEDPFVPLWPRFLPTLMRTLDVVLGLWHAEYQAQLLPQPSQCFVYAISDDEAYLATKQEAHNNHGVFGPGGTAGSVVSGSDRRDAGNLVPKWAGWLNELRNTCLQLLGLLAAQRVLYCPEWGLYQDFCAVVANPLHLQSLEHRHLTQYLKQFIEILLLSCPATLYRSHLSPILRPLLEHVQYRLHYSWEPIIGSTSLSSSSPLTSRNCQQASFQARTGGDVWFQSYYARAGMFVGDLDSVTAEAAAEKARIDLTRSWSDVLQSALALKGDWALVLANQAKEELAVKKNDPSRLSVGPRTRIIEQDASRVNADGTLRGENNVALEARKSLRIHNLCRFLLLEDVHIAGYLTMSIVQCLEYPDAYTCRRCTRICHRILETAAWVEQYTHLVGNQMFSVAVKAIVTEPKWMVGMEWDMMNLIRDIYCRLVLGQTLLPGGQGPAMQQTSLAAASGGTTNDAVAMGGPFEQAKTVDQPLQGGGILVNPSNVPRQIIQSLPGMNADAVANLDKLMMTKRSAKEQKDILRELLSVAAEAVKQSEGGQRNFGGLFGRAVSDESLLQQQQLRRLAPELPPLVKKKAEEEALADASTPNLGELFKLSN